MGSTTRNRAVRGWLVLTKVDRVHDHVDELEHNAVREGHLVGELEGGLNRASKRGARSTRRQTHRREMTSDTTTTATGRDVRETDYSCTA